MKNEFVETISVELFNLKDKKVSIANISYDRTTINKICVIEFKHWELGYRWFEGKDLFDSFCKLRLVLESQGFRILCNGARIDSYPSPMSRNMCGGAKLYKMTIGQRVERKDLLRIFDKADIESVGTVDEQKAYFKKWRKSLNSN